MALVARFAASLSALALGALPQVAHAQASPAPDMFVAPAPSAAPAAPAARGAAPVVIDLSSLEPVIEQFVAENVRRLRRGIAFGPRLSAAGLERTRPEATYDAQLAFGVAFYQFKVPFSFEVQGVIIERVRARLLSYLQQMADSGRTPSRDDVVSAGRTIFEQVADEVLGRHERQDRTFEKPTGTLSLEGGYQPHTRDGFARLTKTWGFWHLHAGPTLSVPINRHPTAYLGLELGLPVVPGTGPRANVYELFGRVEVPLARAADYGVQSTVGIRMLVDLI